jgi:hypothetical protein
VTARCEAHAAHRPSLCKHTRPGSLVTHHTRLFPARRGFRGLPDVQTRNTGGSHSGIYSKRLRNTDKQTPLPRSSDRQGRKRVAENGDGLQLNTAQGRPHRNLTTTVAMPQPLAARASPLRELASVQRHTIRSPRLPGLALTPSFSQTHTLNQFTVSQDPQAVIKHYLTLKAATPSNTSTGVTLYTALASRC